jgi:hypothetical protein
MSGMQFAAYLAQSLILGKLFQFETEALPAVP